MSTVEKDPSKGLNAAVAATLKGEMAATKMTFDALAAQTGISKRALLRYLSTMDRDLNVSHMAVIAAQFALTPLDVVRMAQERLDRAQGSDGKSQGA